MNDAAKDFLKLVSPPLLFVSWPTFNLCPLCCDPQDSIASRGNVALGGTHLARRHNMASSLCKKHTHAQQPAFRKLVPTVCSK